MIKIKLKSAAVPIPYFLFSRLDELLKQKENISREGSEEVRRSYTTIHYIPCLLKYMKPLFDSCLLHFSKAERLKNLAAPLLTFNILPTHLSCVLCSYYFRAESKEGETSETFFASLLNSGLFRLLQYNLLFLQIHISLPILFFC